MQIVEMIHKLHPMMVYASVLTLFPGTPRSEDVTEGRLKEATEIERLELLDFIWNISISAIFKAEHVTIPVLIRGRLPEDKEEMLVLLESLVSEVEKRRFDSYRDRVMGL